MTGPGWVLAPTWTTRQDGELWVIRHGQTEWSRDGLHTSHTDLDLTERGRGRSPGRLKGRLDGVEFDLVLSSPRLRARRTAELAGFADVEPDEDLTEWDYGDYEGLTTADIREDVPGWTVWTHPCPGGESAEQVSERMDRVVGKVRAHGGGSWCSAMVTPRGRSRLVGWTSPSRRAGCSAWTRRRSRCWPTSASRRPWRAGTPEQRDFY